MRIKVFHLHSVKGGGPKTRISEVEKSKYSSIADNIGLSLSAFARYSMARTSGILNQVKKEL